MTRICPKCSYIARDYNYSVLPKGKEFKFKRSLLAAATLLGSGIVIFWDKFQIYPYLFKFISVLAILLGIFVLRLCFKKVSKVCPRCKYDNMPASYEPEGQKIVQEISIKDDSSHICTNCHYKSEHKVESRKYSIVIILFGLFTLSISLMNNPIGLIGSFIIIGTGIYGLSTSLKKRFKCPNCKKKTAIAKDSPEAQALIEEPQP